MQANETSVFCSVYFSWKSKRIAKCAILFYDLSAFRNLLFISCVWWWSSVRYFALWVVLPVFRRDFLSSSSVSMPRKVSDYFQISAAEPKVAVKSSVVQDHGGRLKSVRGLIICYGFACFRRVHKICEKRLLASPCPCPHGTTRLPLDGFWWNLIFDTSSKIYREN